MDNNGAGIKDELSQCQLCSLPGMLEPFTLKDTPMHMTGRLLHFTGKRVNYIKQMLAKVYLFSFSRAHQGSPLNPPGLEPGDRVRVKPYVEIRASLDNWYELRGCGFMEGMTQYCATEQRVHKRIERFMDERDYRVKKSKGIVILEGVQCSGVMGFGRCDRSCYYFWREEWLQKIE